MTRKKAIPKKRVTIVTDEAEFDYSNMDPFDRVKAQFGGSVEAGQVRMTILRVVPTGEAFLTTVDYSEELGHTWSTPSSDSTVPLTCTPERPPRREPRERAHLLRLPLR